VGSGNEIESSQDYINAAHAFVKATLKLGLLAPFVARKQIGHDWIGFVTHGFAKHMLENKSQR